MTAAETKPVEITSTHTLYAQDVSVRALLDMLATRLALQESVTVTNMLKMLASSGSHMSRMELIRVLRALEKEGAGDFFTGRRGMESRFVFADKPHIIAREVTGELDQQESETKRSRLPKSMVVRPEPEPETGPDPEPEIAQEPEPSPKPKTKRPQKKELASPPSAPADIAANSYRAPGDGCVYVTRHFGEGRTADLIVPDDLTTAEAKELQAYIGWLATRPV